MLNAQEHYNSRIYFPDRMQNKVTLIHVFCLGDITAMPPHEAVNVFN